MSWGKVSYVKDLAKKTKDKKIPYDTLHELPNEDVVSALASIKGIGVWTAEMFLLGTLGREDIFSYGDLGLRNAISKLYDVDRNDKEQIMSISEKWKPYRSYASQILWNYLDNKPT
jgi:DNA-3-methyladenine glycosylase II